LVVDDDEWMRTYLRFLLKAANYEVEVAASGNEAMQLLRAELYDILLTDCQMPDMDGVTLCKRVRSEYPTMYILILTIKDTREDRYAGLMAGADEYIIKGDPNSEVITKMNVGRRIRLTDLALAQHDVPVLESGLVDPLTNAPNAKYFDVQMAEEIRRAKRGHRALSVLGCRIVRLRQIADRYGQHAADEALREFANKTRQCLRHGQDWFARIDEDRFIVILPSTRFQRAVRVARKLRRGFAAVRITGAAQEERCAVKIDVTACESPFDASLFRGHDKDVRFERNAGGH
jgi:diguanylate cyclase (GGDEF)-like protein